MERGYHDFAKAAAACGGMWDSHLFSEAAHRLTSVTYPGSKTFSYQYDAVGNRTEMTDPDSGVTTYANGAYADYSYNARDWGRPRSPTAAGAQRRS